MHKLRYHLRTTILPSCRTRLKLFLFRLPGEPVRDAATEPPGAGGQRPLRRLLRGHAPRAGRHPQVQVSHPAGRRRALRRSREQRDVDGHGGGAHLKGTLESEAICLFFFFSYTVQLFVGSLLR